MLKGDGFRLINDRFIDWNKIYDFFLPVCVCTFENRKKKVVQRLLTAVWAQHVLGWESFCSSDETQGQLMPWKASTFKYSSGVGLGHRASFTLNHIKPGGSDIQMSRGLFDSPFFSVSALASVPLVRPLPVSADLSMSFGPVSRIESTLYYRWGGVLRLWESYKSRQTPDAKTRLRYVCAR